MRLIDADAFKKTIKRVCCHAEDETDLLIAIDNTPAVDAVPVVHGKWICGDDMFEYAICSCCKWDSGEAWEYAKKYFIYCPNCGAKMDGKEQEDESRENMG